MDEKKIRIRDVALLDLRKTSEEVLRRIDSLSDISMLLVSERVSPLLANIRMTDVASIMTTPDDINLRMVNGEDKINASAFADGKPIYMMANGHLEIMPDVTPEMIINCVKMLVVNGELTCPYSVLGALAQAGAQINGQTDCYPDGAIRIGGKLQLDEGFAANSEPGIYCVNSLSALDADAAQTAIERGLTFFTGKLVSYESMKPFAAKLLYQGSCRKQVFIPDGYACVDGNVKWDKYRVRKLSGAFYIDGDLSVDSAVSPAAFDGITGIKVARTLKISEELMDALDARDDLEIDYGELSMLNAQELVFNDDATLTAQALEALPSKYALRVNGDVMFTADVTPELVLNRISALNINGDCTCPDALSAVLASLGTINGDIIHLRPDQDGASEIPAPTPEPDDSDEYIIIQDIAKCEL